MSPYLILGLIGIYFSILILAARATRGKGDNATFFSANRDSHWGLVAFGMIGTSLSGVTFISVPGQVSTAAFSYLQLVMGYLIGYLVIAFVLMPLYYRLSVVSIYTYLAERFGPRAYQTGAWLFLVSRSLGSAARYYLVLGVLQMAVFEPLGVPFWVSVLLGLALIWVYTYQGGVKTIVVTDTLQTASMLAALGASIVLIAQALGQTPGGLIADLWARPSTQVFFWDWRSGQFFGKQLVAGALLAIVMTGLDQDMMQKNLTCRTLGQAQKNMLTFMGILFGVNLLFLLLGAALIEYTAQMGLTIPTRTDDLFPMIALEHLPIVAGLVFVIGIIAATYASTDSALTALTTSFCVDVLGMTRRPARPNDTKTRVWVHVGFTLWLFVLTILFRQAAAPSLLTVVFTLAGYTYGPLLGLFAYGVLTRHRAWDGAIPLIAVASPLMTLAIDWGTRQIEGGYRFGFELLALNGLITFLLLALSSRINKAPSPVLSPIRGEVAQAAASGKTLPG